MAKTYTIHQLRQAWGAGVHHGKQSTITPEKVDYEKKFNELAEKEPRLKEVEYLAKAFRAVRDNWPSEVSRRSTPPRPDAEYFWYHVLKPMMYRLVGHSRSIDFPEISESEQWDIAYEYLCGIAWPAEYEVCIIQRQERS